MRFYAKVTPHNLEDAFEALWSRDGAQCFKHIGKYSKYTQRGSKITCSFRSRYGPKVTSTMTVVSNKIYFETTAPFVNVQGTWSKMSNNLILEQTVRCPCFAVPLIRRLVRQTLDDLKRI